MQNIYVPTLLSNCCNTKMRSRNFTKILLFWEKVSLIVHGGKYGDKLSFCCNIWTDGTPNCKRRLCPNMRPSPKFRRQYCKYWREGWETQSIFTVKRITCSVSFMILSWEHSQVCVQAITSSVSHYVYSICDFFCRNSPRLLRKWRIWLQSQQTQRC